MINFTDVKNVDILAPIGVCVLIIHMLVGGFSFFDSESVFHYHQYKGAVGIIICLIRCAIFAFFMWTLSNTFKKAKATAKTFLRLFTFSSTIYILGFPMLWVLTETIISGYFQ